MFDLPSTVDWCEQNYILSEYVAEYWNTLTGLCLIVSGVLYYKNNYDWIRASRYQNVFTRLSGLLVFVGVGTMLFHGTLYYQYQLLDELPMIYLANEYLGLLLLLRTTGESINLKQYDRLIAVIKYSTIMVPIIILSYFLHSSLQVLTFHLTLKVAEGSVLFVLYRLSKSLNRIVYSKIYITQDILKRQRTFEKTQKMMSSTPGTIGINVYNRFKRHNPLSDSVLINIVQTKIKKYLDLRNRLNFVTNIGIYIYGSSIAIWCLENMFCRHLQPFQLHAIWHVLSSIGVYHLNLLMQLHVSIEKFVYSE
jgi:hypothetical protein